MRIADPQAPTKEKILDAAMGLMLRKGFTATSVEDILAASGAVKGSFFHFFKSKEALAHALVDRFFCAQTAMFDAAPFNKEKDPLKRVFGRIDAVIAAFSDPTKPKSCLLGNFSQELANTDPVMRAACAAKFDEGAAPIRIDLESAAKSRSKMKNVDAEALSRLYIAIIQGSLVVGKAKRNDALAVENMRQYRRYIAMLFGEDGA